MSVYGKTGNASASNILLIFKRILLQPQSIPLILTFISRILYNRCPAFLIATMWAPNYMSTVQEYTNYLTLSICKEH